MVNLQDEIKRNIDRVRENIELAATRSGRSAGEICLMGVTKFQPLDAIYAALSCGLSFFGENRVQERDEKKSKWDGPDATWHMIGHLQRNKARRALELFDCIQSVDNFELASALERIIATNEDGERHLSPYPIMAEVNVSGEESKQGVSPEKCFALIEDIAVKCPHIEIKGLMTIGPISSDERMIGESFATLRGIRDDARGRFGLALPHLSMGMSGDYAIAIEEGSTIVRIGGALFGARDR
ncbi:MAG: YggS family pyridoxal phosphate-dependent enzyme [Synergistaceae bacterium]|jgi:pyridoxal phosphate enzyme (YggS family)|nr:YggS family pyridoxal phosphate-dependent enzyme [Synergistaceae bacterium]